MTWRERRDAMRACGITIETARAAGRSVRASTKTWRPVLRDARGDRHGPRHDRGGAEPHLEPFLHTRARAGTGLGLARLRDPSASGSTSSCTARAMADVQLYLPWSRHVPPGSSRGRAVNARARRRSGVEDECRGASGRECREDLVTSLDALHGLYALESRCSHQARSPRGDRLVMPDRGPPVGRLAAQRPGWRAYMSWGWGGQKVYTARLCPHGLALAV